MEKKNETITLHISAEQKLRFKKLAEADGSTCSEMACEFIYQYLLKRESDFRLLQEVFEEKGSDGT